MRFRKLLGGTAMAALLFGGVAACNDDGDGDDGDTDTTIQDDGGTTGDTGDTGTTGDDGLLDDEDGVTGLGDDG